MTLFKILGISSFFLKGPFDILLPSDIQVTISSLRDPRDTLQTFLMGAYI